MKAKMRAVSNMHLLLSGMLFILCVFAMIHYLSYFRLVKIIESIRTSEEVKILMWTSFFTETISQKYLSTCPELKCSIVNDRKDFNNSRAVVFHDRDVILKDLPTVRKYNQHFVFFLMESPYHTSVEAYPYLSTNFYTKTMTYRRDSDIQIPFGYVQKRKSPQPFDLDSWYQLAKGKTKMIAWWVSNCRTPSKREEYVAELRRYIQVDIYGNCGNFTCPRSMIKKCEEDLRRDYRFYFVFENSICLDFVTEKFFDRLNDDVVPIVPSRKLYENLAPPNSFIAADDFPTPRALAEYLHLLSNSLDDYLKYFEWKKEYESIGFPYGMYRAFCTLCQSLLNENPHYLVQPTPSAANVSAWYSKPGVCLDDFIHQLLN
ncbi:Alpha-(1,3)-fucosyltransferase C [Trichinella pseudospiralis]|uniref:Fucosyltransferase n=1 Tax=Trichinella pseudospiralis TaxID=6337 RepID=A0A0V1E4F9_TRIPS|nr:Alpha-(1,3)-fucosyltransferase C [Trichinella pseudospiralis]KRZ25400.1 Alpha-(1,3)-fucosyltransferase C [Trichinella pseudospiralis]KRZ32356.1 Alpha-(1,3)-fucosyltransferase C [Trichinella pseudospiralis]